jgi:hypothetical protein
LARSEIRTGQIQSVGGSFVVRWTEHAGGGGNAHVDCINMLTALNRHDVRTRWPGAKAHERQWRACYVEQIAINEPRGKLSSRQGSARHSFLTAIQQRESSHSAKKRRATISYERSPAMQIGLDIRAQIKLAPNPFHGLFMRRFRLHHLIVLFFAILYMSQMPFAATHLDFARDVFIATRFSDHGFFPWRGPVFAGSIHLGPVWYCLLALLLYLSHNWLVVVLALGAFGALQFPLAYLLGKELGSRNIGMVLSSALLFPSWSTFEQFLPLHYILTTSLDLALLISVARYWRKPRRKYLAAVVLCFVLALHAHPVSVVFAWVCVPLIFWAVSNKSCSVRDLLVAGLCGAIPFIPYLMWNVAHDFADFRAVNEYLGSGVRISSLSAALSLLWQSSFGGSLYWFTSEMKLPTIISVTFATVAILATIIGFFGLLFGICTGSVERRKALAILLFVVLTWTTIALMRDVTPFYMTTPLHLVLAVLFALGIESVSWLAAVRHVRTAFSASAVLGVLLCTICIARHQVSGDFRFSFFPLYAVSSPPQPLSSTTFVPAYAMMESGKFFCLHDDATVHGVLARHILYDYAIEMRLSCGRNDVRVGGDDAKRTHWLGMPEAMYSRLGLYPATKIGAMGIFSVRPVSTGPGRQVPDTPIYPAYVPKITNRETREYHFVLRPGGEVVITNVAFFVPNPAVRVEFDGRPVEALVADGASSVYSCNECEGEKSVVLSISSTDLSDVDVVVI